LHSRSLRWSGGAVIDRETDRVIRELAAKPVAEMVVALSGAGFAGICIDRYGYLDHGVAIESRLRSALGIEPIVSQNGRRSFFLLDPGHIAELRLLNRPQKDSDALQAPTTVSAGDGCWPLEGTVEHNWHWCGREGEIIVSNPTNKTRTVKLNMILATGHPELSSITVRGPSFSQTLQANDSGIPFSVSVLARPGDSILHLTSDAMAVVSSADPRTLVFLVRNLQLTE
jgi:phosphoglycerol transferase